MIEKKLNPQAAKIIQWRECLSTLPDHHFFEIMRMYLGEVKTPYNKQKLIEELSSFIRRDENKNIIVQLLTDDDCLVLTAICVIPRATQEKLITFFTGTFSFAELYEHLLNLEERLLIYKYLDVVSNKTVFALNPLLEDTLHPHIHQSLLVPESIKEKEVENHTHANELTPQILASLFTFVCSEPGLCKADGGFKKKTETSLVGTFPQVCNSFFLQKLIFALKNLSVFHQSENGLVCDYAKWRQFAELEESTQYAYIAAAARNHLPRDILQKQAQLILDVVSYMTGKLYTKKSLLRIAFLTQEKTSYSTEPRKQGKFASILQKSQSTDHEVKEANSIDIIEDAIFFGLIQKQGFDDEDEPLYSSSPRQALIDRVQTLSIDAGFSVTILPGMSLKQLIPLVHCMHLVSCDTILRLEITRQSCMRCFDNGISPQTLFTDLDNATSHQIPQNLHISIEEWYKSFTSASLYKGYILQVATDKQVLVEKNPELSRYINHILTTGIYLMDFASNEEATDVITRSGLDFIGGIKTLRQSSVPLPYVNLRSQNDTVHLNDEKCVSHDFTNEQEDIINNLKDHVKTLDCSNEQKEGLLSRIQRKIILNSIQLRCDSVRLDKIEAGGMDFLGKIHVIEYAISTNSMVEFTYDDSSLNNEIIIGQPLSLDKQQSDAIVKIRKEPDSVIIEKSIGKARLVKRIRGSLFKEHH